MRLIKQKQESDCAICCLSMLTGIAYKKVIKLIGDCWHPKKGMQDTTGSLLFLGFKQKKIKITEHGYRIVDIDFKKSFKPYEISSSQFRDQIWGRRALLSVPSLNIKNGTHMVYWHYDKLYDPSTKKTYKEFKDLRPREIVLFRENLR